MKICIISDFYSPSIGGTQKLAECVVKSFITLGHEVEVVSSHDPNRGLEKYNYKINEVPTLNFYQNNFFSSKFYDAVFIFADLGSTSWQTFETSSSFLNFVVLNLDENVYKWIKEEKFGYTKESIKNVTKKLKEYTSIVSFCRDAPVNKFLTENDISHTFIQNFTEDLSKFIKEDFNIHKTLGLDVNKKILFNHGLFEPRKNQYKLIEAFIEQKLNRNYSLVFLGSPRISGDEFLVNPYDRQTVEYFLKCKKLVEKNSLQNSIKFVKGSNNKKLIASLIDKSDIYVLPSTAEGLPLVLLEAMSCDKPWISTPVGGVPGVLGDLGSGVILENIDFSSVELKQAISKLESEQCKSSRVVWEEGFTEKIVGKKYNNLLHHNSLKHCKNKISFVCHAFNESTTLVRYLDSCLKFKDFIGEVVIVDHRSTDNTKDVVSSFKQSFDAANVKLSFYEESRDFSKNFTFADIRGETVQKSCGEYVFVHDADFLFSNNYKIIIQKAIKIFEQKDVYAISYEIPVMNNGRACMHPAVPRIVKKSKTVYRQNHVGKKYEWAYPIHSNCSKNSFIDTPKNSILSINTKTEEAAKLRRTMTTYFEDVFSGKVSGNWLDEYENNNLTPENTFFDNIENNKCKQIKIDISLFKARYEK